MVLNFLAESIKSGFPGLRQVAACFKDKRNLDHGPLDVANTVPVASRAFSLLNFCDVNVRREFCELSLVVLIRGFGIFQAR